jgi:Transglutaminase-like superfamily
MTACPGIVTQTFKRGTTYVALHIILYPGPGKCRVQFFTTIFFHRLPKVVSAAWMRPRAAYCIQRLGISRFRTNNMSLHYVVIDQAIVILDTSTGRYSLVECDDPQAVVGNASGAGLGEDRYVTKGDGQRVLELVNNGFQLAVDARVALSHDKHGIGLQELAAPDVRCVPRPDLADIVNVGLDVLWATSLLKLRSIECIARDIVLYRQRHSRVPSASLSQYTDALEVYKRSRVFFYNPRDRCLLNSLSLLRYLARFGVFPTWVFGVRLHPFGAHCWLASDSHVFEGLSVCGQYQPIMEI